MKTTIQKYMTRALHTIGQEQTLDVAHTVMRQHGIRHLPVLEGGKLVGLLSQRDLHSSRPSETSIRRRQRSTKR